MRAVSTPRVSIRSLDPTDERILRLLVRDARASYRDLGESVGLSANAVAQRMRRLEQVGVIRGYTALLETRADEDQVVAVVMVTTTIDADAVRIEAALASMPEVAEVLDLAGPVDYEVRLVCRTQRELYDAVNTVRGLPGITGMQTRPVLRHVLRR